MNILLVDDHGIVADGLEALLKTRPGFNVIAKCTNGEYALAHIKASQIDLLITDYSMPDMDGKTLVTMVKRIAPQVKIIVLSMHDEAYMVQDIISAGIDGYILKKYSQQELLQAVDIISRGGQFWSAEISRILVRKLQQDDTVILTDREIEVLKLLVNEMTSKEIAEKLFISERTVETHRKNLMRKTNSSGTVGLVKYAYANNYV